ncbi:MAG: MGMT family protein [Patescibacteria group bacterium]|jgi:methylated-DNA-protein-cysteine methyltransferase-like protein
MKPKSNFYALVYAMVKKIPRGKVATYGQIASLIGSPKAAQMVGWALHALDENPHPEVPWQRVINRLGFISTTCLEHTADEQAWLLQKEGVKVVKKEKMWFVDLDKYLWKK